MVAGGACVVGGHAWLPGVHGCQGACMGYDKIQSISGQYASYWNAFLLLDKLAKYRVGPLS